MNAKDYKKLASAKRLEGEIFEVKVPSGGVWKLTEPPIEQFVLAGKLPASLVGKMAEAARKANGSSDKPNGQEILKNLTTEDLLTNLSFGRDLLLHCAVEPKISLNPSNDDEIAPEDILPEDFTFLLNWLLSGGKSGAQLDTFHSE